MKTARNITLVSLLAAGVMSASTAYGHTDRLHRDFNRWAEGSAIKGTLTFTEPNQHGYDFAAQVTSGNTQHTKFVGTKEKLDWALGLEHRLAGGWSRLFLDYDHYETDESSRFTTLAGQQTDLLGVGGGGPLESFGQYDIDADSVKLGMRHRVNHSAKSLIDVGAALSWVDVDRDFTATQTAGAATRRLVQEADFEGFGPYFDVMVKHYTHRKNRTGFNVQMYAGAGLLYSETKFSSTLFDTANVTVEDFDREKLKGVSSEMMAKLAVGWDYRFCNRSMLSTTLGWMFMHYSDAFGGQTAGSFARFAAQTGGGTHLGGAGNASGGIPFTRQGPYLEFKWSGANF